MSIKHLGANKHPNTKLQAIFAASGDDAAHGSHHRHTNVPKYSELPRR